jgi:hypothetical protein
VRSSGALQETSAHAAAVLTAVQQDKQNAEVIAPFVHTLVKFMADKVVAEGSLEKPSDDPIVWSRTAARDCHACVL